MTTVSSAVPMPPSAGVNTPAPVSRSERISSLDAARGFALLGILLMNIVSFGLPMQAYDNPSIAGGDSGANLWVWLINSILFEGKMRAIFSMLFGAGFVILTLRAEERGAGIAVADIYYRRTLWLLAFGILHGYLLWYGDILYAYGLVGLMLFPLRKLAARHLITAGLVLVVSSYPAALLEANHIRSTREAAQAADTLAAAGATLTEEQVAAQRAWEEKRKEVAPGPEELAAEVNAMRGSFSETFTFRAGYTFIFQTVFFYRFAFLDVLSMMLLGMGLLKLGFFSARRSYGEYAAIALVGYAAGCSLNAWAALRFLNSGFDPVVLYMNWTFTYGPGRLLVALAHVSVLMLVCKSGAFGFITSRLAAVGQMALTNYLLTSLICTTVFYGYGFGLFGQLERYQLYYVLAGVWTFQLITSKIWLSHFRFGPMEWVWRSLTYWQRQPMRLSQAQAASAGAAAGA